MFSLAGVPPTVGFYAKLSVIAGGGRRRLRLAGRGRGDVLAVGAFYYLRVVKLMYFDEPVDTTPIEARADTRVLLSVNGLALLLLGIFPAAADGLVRHRALTHSY